MEKNQEVELTTIILDKEIQALNQNAVTIIEKRYIEIDGEKQMVGYPNAYGYENSLTGREKLRESEEGNIINSIMAMWGETPTIQEESEEE